MTTILNIITYIAVAVGFGVSIWVYLKTGKQAPQEHPQDEKPDPSTMK
ncbi:hypothetical protein RugamoR64_23480 [Duganella rhizosphaerae]